MPPVSGIEVLESTPGVNLFPLAVRLNVSENYELVDVWQKPHDTKWDMSFVRFVYCHKDHVNRDGLHPDFVARRDEFTNFLVELANSNLWATQAHLNPYLEKDGTRTNHRVLMFGSAGRKPNIEVYRDGRDEYNQGLGPKVILSTLATHLDLIDLKTDKEIVLVVPNTN